MKNQHKLEYEAFYNINLGDNPLVFSHKVVTGLCVNHIKFNEHFTVKKTVGVVLDNGPQFSGATPLS